MQDYSLYAYASERKSSCLIAVLYITTSVTLSLVNKIVLSKFKFDVPAFLMFIRTLCTIIGLEIAKFLGAFSLPTYSLSRGQTFAWPSLFYSVSILMSLSALSEINIAIFAVLKGCTPLTTMFLSVLILKTDFPSKLTIASLIILAAGCIIAGIGDVSLSFVAFALCALSNVAQSLNLLFIQRVSRNGLTPIECVHINNINTLPIFAINVVLFNEIDQILDFPYYTEPTFLTLVVMQICLGCMLTYLIILCTSMTSAVTTTLIGGVKTLIQVVVGIITLGGLNNSLTTYIGMSLNITGSVTYLIFKIRKKMKSKSEDLKRVSVISENNTEIMDENNEEPNAECNDSNEKADRKTFRLEIS